MGLLRGTVLKGRRLPVGVEVGTEGACGSHARQGSGQPPAPASPVRTRTIMCQMGQEDNGNISMCFTLSASPNQDSSKFPVLSATPSRGIPTPCMGVMFSRRN